MPRKKKEKETMLDYRVESLAVAPRNVHAVFYDAEEENYEFYPVISFAVGTMTVSEDDEPVDKARGVIRGLMSGHGGLELIEDQADLEFIGYWRRDSQPKLEEFLADHGIENVPTGEGRTIFGDAPDYDEDEDDE